jgi:hypothetical protein
LAALGLGLFQGIEAFGTDLHAGQFLRAIDC